MALTSNGAKNVTEKLVKEALKKYLKSIGAYYYMPVPMGYGASTIDFLVCHKGKFYGIETKKKGLRPTVSQMSVMKYIEIAGGLCWCEDSVDLETTRDLLRWVQLFNLQSASAAYARGGCEEDQW